MGLFSIFAPNKNKKDKDKNTPSGEPVIVDVDKFDVIDDEQGDIYMANDFKEDKPLDTIEQRLQFVRNAYQNLSDIIDKLPIPDDFKQKIKNGVLNDKELGELMDSIDTHRPPKILLMGRTGAGKSSLINAICGSYVAFVNDIESQRPNQDIYEIKDGDRVLMEIFDTRGIAESKSLDENISAEELLVQQLNEFAPDVAVLVLDADRRDNSVNEDAKYLKEVIDKYMMKGNTRLPVVVAINQCDKIMPNSNNIPPYNPKKLGNIRQRVNDFFNSIKEENLEVKAVVPVASWIQWQDSLGNELYADDINNLTPDEISRLQIQTDYRYNIENLRNALLEAIPDVEAKRGFNLAFKLEELIQKLAKRVNIIFSGISSVVSATPIPIADLYVLLTLQAVLVSFIAMLSGRKINLKTAMEFIASMGGVVAAGNVFRLAAHQLVKLIPVAGSVVSAGIAYVGTWSIGRAAIAYYIDKTDMNTVKNNYEKDKKKDRKTIEESL
ncbi:MAG: 50S ribosome-binding GTPase [Ruminococcus flavefaciens]|nr:50S ribosome-binding GTPase [Ruminococcus flavefaciens]MCM1228498.1 50S ribosome-binding GTPase [Ruminococcus flavefaciens]